MFSENVGYLELMVLFVATLMVFFLIRSTISLWFHVKKNKEDLDELKFEIDELRNQLTELKKRGH